MRECVSPHPGLSLPTSLGRGNPPYKRDDGIRWPWVKAEKGATSTSSTCKGELNTSAMGVLLRTDTASKAISHLSKDMGNDKIQDNMNYGYSWTYCLDKDWEYSSLCPVGALVYDFLIT